jgi:hypothetical protein
MKPIHAILLSSEQLAALYRYLTDVLGQTECDSTLRWTMVWAAENDIDADVLTRGIRRWGVRCDCQVIFYLYRATPDDIPHSVLF